MEANVSVRNFIPLQRLLYSSNIPLRSSTNSGLLFSLNNSTVYMPLSVMGIAMYRLNLTGPIGLVVGNEGEGVSRLVKEKCDFVASIPMKGDIDSLNASVAAGVLAYEIVRQRG